MNYLIFGIFMGMLCFIAGCLFVWNLYETKRKEGVSK